MWFSRETFEQLLEEALSEAWKSRDFADLSDVTVPPDVAIGVHEKIQETCFNHMMDRRDLTEGEQALVRAYGQAIFCYRILWTFQFAIEMEVIEKAQKLKRLNAKAKRLLVAQGLPSTLEEWGDPSGNHYWIEIDAKALNASLKTDLESLAREFESLAREFREFWADFRAQMEEEEE